MVEERRCRITGVGVDRGTEENGRYFTGDAGKKSHSLGREAGRMSKLLRPHFLLSTFDHRDQWR